jgi:hypothetical protein
MGTSEGQDGEYNATYWDNPGLTFPSQNLPSWSAFQNAFPTNNGNYMAASQVYQLVGGQLYNSHLNNPNAYSNACAIRVSRALNYSGVVVPDIFGQTEKGADNKNYFLNAKNLNQWMRKTFGIPIGSNHITGAQGELYGVNFPSLLSGRKGIYIMIANYPGLFATGHADIINNSNCPGECWFNPKGGVHYIDIWELN